MADFCAACVVELFDVPREANDLADDALVGAWFWDLCEGCGFHLFDGRGERLCGGSGPPELASLDGCSECIRLRDGGPPGASGVPPDAGGATASPR